MRKIKNFFTNNYYFSILLIIFSFYFLMRGNFFGYYCPDCSFTSRDLMWLPSKILSENINFYELIKNNQYENFSGYKENSNYPMYSIITHFLLLPLGYIKFTEAKEIWLILNCILIFHIFVIFKQNILINKKKLILILIIFLLSKSLVYNIGLGQFSVICLYGFITFFYFKKFLSKICPVIIATMKYTFAPVLGLYLIFTKNYLLILSILLINILSVLFFSYWFKENFIEILISQYSIPKKFYTSGAIDFMTLIGNHPAPPFNFITTIFLLVIFYYIFFRNTYRNKLADLSGISLITIISIRHLYYDMTFLLPFLIYVLIQKKINKICLLIIFYFFYIYFNSIVYTEIRYNKLFMLINFFIMCYPIIFIFLNNTKLKLLKKNLLIKKIFII